VFCYFGEIRSLIFGTQAGERLPGMNISLGVLKNLVNRIAVESGVTPLNTFAKNFFIFLKNRSL